MLDDLTWEQACEKEIEFIKLYGRSDLGLGSLCNLTEGGEGVIGMRHSDETKKKLSEDNKRPEKMVICMENYKKMITPEAIAKATANRDYKEITRKRLLKTDYNKIREASQKAVLQYDLKGNFIREWKSITEAGRILNIASPNITKCCKGLRNIAGEFIWKYVDNNIAFKVKPYRTIKKEVFKYDINMHFICKYESVREASIKSNVPKANITACCNKKCKKAGGYIWRFAKINNN
jgi:hypothetical protein